MTNGTLILEGISFCFTPIMNRLRENVLVVHWHLVQRMKLAFLPGAVDMVLFLRVHRFRVWGRRLLDLDLHMHLLLEFHLGLSQR